MTDISLNDYLQYVLALVFVLALIVVIAMVARRFGVGGAAPKRRGRERRLSVSEALVLDGKRKLMLIRRDDTEHLILIGAGTETVVERGIAAKETEFAAAAKTAAAVQSRPGTAPDGNIPSGGQSPRTEPSLGRGERPE